MLVTVKPVTGLTVTSSTDSPDNMDPEVETLPKDPEGNGRFQRGKSCRLVAG